MTLVDSLMVSLLGMGVVFLILISLSLLIQVLSVVLGNVTNKATGQQVPEVFDEGWTAGELKLIGVDEPTAAMIMAIVSDESQIPLSELNFKMIKAIDQSLQ